LRNKEIFERCNEASFGRQKWIEKQNKKYFMDYNMTLYKNNKLKIEFIQNKI